MAQTLKVNNIADQAGTGAPSFPSGATVSGGTLTSTNLVVDTTTLVVDATNNFVGMGTATPAEELHVRGANATTTLLVENTGANTGVGITCVNSQGIVETTTADPLVFRAGTTEVMRIDTAGAVTLGLASTSPTHRINTLLRTTGSDTLTLTNGPAGTAGNPTLYIEININGATYAIPAWAL